MIQKNFRGINEIYNWLQTYASPLHFMLYNVLLIMRCEENNPLFWARYQNKYYHIWTFCSADRVYLLLAGQSFNTLTIWWISVGVNGTSMDPGYDWIEASYIVQYICSAFLKWCTPCCMMNVTLVSSTGLISFINYLGPLLSTWISNHMHSKLLDEITYPFPNFNVKVWEWISNFIPYYMAVITYPCWE